MVDYEYSELYKQESIDKQMNIAFDGGNITNSDIHSEEFELEESLCSDSQLRFGSCEASMIKFRISNIFTPLKDKWLTVTETLNHNTDTPFKFGEYKVHSDTPTADRRYRDVVAYDKMYDIINADLTEWYNSLFPTDDTEVTLKEFRDSLMNYLGVEHEDVTLVNDDMIIKKTIQPTQLAGRDVVSAICEINGCFGHIGRDGKFHYVFLPKYTQGLYPSNNLYPSNDLYPRDSSANKIDTSLYIDCKYEDYLSQRITKLQIRQEENDIGKTYPDGNVTDNDNVYSVTDNFLVYGKEETELEDIAKKLYSVIYGTEYRPYEAEVVGNPCLEVGDAIRFNTSYQIVESYILKRTLSGVQGLRDELSADGEEYLSENASGIETQIQQIKGKSNVLERNIDETVSKISDVEQGLKSEISQTAESITSTVASAQSKWNTVDSDGNIVSISEYGYGLDGTITGSSYIFSDTLNVGDIYLDQETGYGWACTSISSIDEKRVALFGYRPKHTFSLITDELSSRIEQTISSISLEINNGDKTAGIVITLENEDGTTSEVTGTIEMTGIVTFNDLKGEGQTVINGSNITTGTIDADKVNVINVVAESVAAENITGTTISGKTISGGEIDGAVITSKSGNYISQIESGIIKTTLIQLISPSNGGFVPGITKLNSIESTVTNGIYLKDAETTIVRPVHVTLGSGGSATNYPYVGILSEGRIYSDGAICPDGSNEHSCGTSEYKWTQVYATKSAINTSDKNKKHDINEVSEIYEKIFFATRPVTYMLNGGDRVHIGAISQEIEQSMNDLGIEPEMFSAFCKDVKKTTVKNENGECIEAPLLDEDGNVQYEYGLRYGEYIMLNTHMIQKAYERIESQQSEIDELKKSVSFLMQKLGGKVDE